MSEKRIVEWGLFEAMRQKFKAKRQKTIEDQAKKLACEELSMEHLRIYLMISLHAPQLVWNALAITYVWSLFDKMQQDAADAGFGLTANAEVGTHDKRKEYQLGPVKRNFKIEQNEFVIEDWMKRHIVGVFWTLDNAKRPVLFPRQRSVFEEMVSQISRTNVPIS